MNLPVDELRALATREIGHDGSKPLFVAISGAHLYGFPSPDSDFDVRGAHLIPVSSLLSLSPPDETTEFTGEDRGREIDLVSHDARKFFRLMLNRNGYVLEQVFSPLVLVGGADLEELRAIASGCVTRGLHHHYRGFFETQLGLHQREQEARAKTMLYMYRVLLTGIHALRTGRIESNLNVLLQEYSHASEVLELIEAKTRELATLRAPEVDRHRGRIDRLRGALDEAWSTSTLPDEPVGKAELENLLLRLRDRELASVGANRPLAH